MGLEYPEASRLVGVPTEALRGGSPLPLWVTPDDLLIVGVRSLLGGNLLRLGGMIWHPDGTQHELNTNITPPNDGSLNFTSVQLHYGYLVHAAVMATSNIPNRGQTLASIQIARPPASAFRTRWFLGMDYVTGMNVVAWPPGRVVSGVEGPGLPIRVAVANPAAGADWTTFLINSTRWRVWGAQATLVTSAAVANRIPNLRLDDGTGTGRLLVPTTLTIPASTTRTVNWVPGYPSVGTDVAASLLSGIAAPVPFLLAQAGDIRVQTTNLQVGDQWSAITVLVEQWLED